MAQHSPQSHILDSSCSHEWTSVCEVPRVKCKTVLALVKWAKTFCLCWAVWQFMLFQIISWCILILSRTSTLQEHLCRLQQWAKLCRIIICTILNNNKYCFDLQASVKTLQWVISFARANLMQHQRRDLFHFFSNLFLFVRTFRPEMSSLYKSPKCVNPLAMF